jgi:hypothetical protein
MGKTIAEVSEARRFAEDLIESHYAVGFPFLKGTCGDDPWVYIASLTPRLGARTVSAMELPTVDAGRGQNVEKSVEPFGKRNRTR